MLGLGLGLTLGGAATSTGASFTPASLLSFWYRQSGRVVTAAPDVDSIVAEVGGGTFGALSQGVAGNKPHESVAIGTPSLLWDGTDDVMASTAAAAAWNPLHAVAGFTHIFVLYVPSGFSSGVLIDNHNRSTTNAGISIELISTGVVRVIIGNGSSNVYNYITTLTIPTNALFSLEVYYSDAAGLSVSVNDGTPENTAIANASSATAAFGVMGLGGRSPTAGVNQQMHFLEWGGAPGILSGAQITQVRDYLIAANTP